MKKVLKKDERRKPPTTRKNSSSKPPVSQPSSSSQSSAPRRLKNKLYICGLLPTVLREELIREFGKFGKLHDVWVAKKPPGFAFVEYINSRDAERVVHELDDSKVLGSKVRIEFAKANKGPEDSKKPKKILPLSTSNSSGSKPLSNKPVIAPLMGQLIVPSLLTASLGPNLSLLGSPPLSGLSLSTSGLAGSSYKRGRSPRESRRYRGDSGSRWEQGISRKAISPLMRRYSRSPAGRGRVVYISHYRSERMFGNNMTTVEQPCFTLINIPNDSDMPSETQLKQELEHGDIKTKTDALKKLIHMILNGEKMQSLLMTVIRFVMPLQDHTIKKLLLVFWEIVTKYSPDGRMLQEMILVCDAYRKDLQHPNEFIRGSTLRFLCKLKEPELLEPLMAPIKACLEHRHSYVRRNAVLAIYTIYRNFEFLMPDAPELIANYLEGEADSSCKRNAFMMLIHADQEKALSYLSSCIDQVHTFGDILQLVIVELIYKVCHANPTERARFIRCIYNLLNSSSPAVRYEAAGTLVTLSNAPTAIKAAAQCYIELIVKESDNNVKLIVLDRLIALKESPAQEKVLQELAMDILRVLSAPDLEVRKKTLNLSLDLVSSRNVEEMVLVLKKEVMKTNNSVEHEDAGKYRQLLVRTLHQCTVKFPDVAATIIPLLIELLSDQNELAATDVLVFVREAVQRFEQLRPIIINKLLDTFSSIKSLKIHRAALWILGEYCTTKENIQRLMTLIRQSLGEIPIVDDELRKIAGEKEEDTQMTQGSVQRLVTADGTYASQSAFSASVPTKKEQTRPPLRQFLADGDFFIGAALSTTLTKLALRFATLTQDKQKQNVFMAEAMLIMAAILHYGKSGLPNKPITDDDVDRIATCIRVLSEHSPFLVAIFSDMCRSSLSNMLAIKIEEEKELQKVREKKPAVVQADDPITFLQLIPRGEFWATENVFDLTLSQALGVGNKKESDIASSSKLNKVTQLTGFSDPVYAEAYVNVNQYDIVLDVLIVNQTQDTLQNLTLELATLGDLKLVEKPPPVVLGSRDFTNIKASVKVASTENGIIFGNIVYDVSGAASDRNSVVLNDIHIDIMDYIVPASCTDTEFRQMWAEFEWENKVAVNTNITDLHEYLEHLIKCTNMKCLTPDKALHGECGFMAANLYAKSIFGEDALANLSIEKPADQPDGTVTGHIRIRAKSQGMALSMGDKINLSQKKSKVVSPSG